jgi:hypothetical protein
MKTTIRVIGWGDGKDIHTIIKHFGKRVSFLGTTAHPSCFELADYADEDIEVLKGLGITAQEAKNKT